MSTTTNEPEQRHPMKPSTVTLIGGPTALLELGGVRFLTDPTFDAPRDYQLPHVLLEKTAGPALSLQQLGRIDAVLVSHDQHPDNLDASGRTFVTQASNVFTTPAGAIRLGGAATGLRPWQRAELSIPGRPRFAITATPARHGPAGIEPLSGDVTGFMLSSATRDLVYITGDTVWFDGVAEVSRQRSPAIVLVFAGAAKTRGAIRLTMDANDVIEVAHAFPEATIVAIHVDGWRHFTESRRELEAAFHTLGLESRLRSIQPGETIPLDLPVDTFV